MVPKNGEKIPVINAEVNMREPLIRVSSSMPVVEGMVKGHVASVIRDSGRNPVIVRRDLVLDGKMTGAFGPVSLLDRTVKYLPEVEIIVDALYYTEKVLGV